jgi:hypothetical protein
MAGQAFGGAVHHRIEAYRERLLQDCPTIVSPGKSGCDGVVRRYPA